MRDPATGLTDRQAAFVREYLIDFNATNAYIRAGGSAKTAYSAGPRMLRDVAAVAAAVAKALPQVVERNNITVDRVVQEYARIAFADMRRFTSVNEDGGVRLIDSDKWTDDDAAAVAEVGETRTKEGGSLRFKLHDKIRALDSLAKYLGVFPADGVNVNVSGDKVLILRGRDDSASG